MVIGNRITKLHKNPIFFATDWKSECLLVSLFNSVSLWCVPTFGVDGGLIWIWHIHTLLTAEVQHVHTLKWSILLAHVQKQWEQQLSHIEKTHKLTCKVVQERHRCQEDPIYFILSHSKSHLITAHSLQPHSFFFLHIECIKFSMRIVWDKVICIYCITNINVIRRVGRGCGLGLCQDGVAQKHEWMFNRPQH